MHTVVECCAPIQDESLAAEQATRLAEWYGVLADPTRLRLLSLISAAGEACAAIERAAAYWHMLPLASQTSTTDAGGWLSSTR